MWAAAGTGWWSVLARAKFQLSATPGAGLAALLIGFGALAYALSVAVHYLLEAFEDAAASKDRCARMEQATK